MSFSTQVVWFFCAGLIGACFGCRFILWVREAHTNERKEHFNLGYLYGKYRDDGNAADFINRSFPRESHLQRDWVRGYCKAIEEENSKE